MTNITGGHAVTLEGTDVHLRDVTGATARIQVASGNNVCDYRVPVPGRADPVAVLVSPDASGGYSYGNPILFPFPNRVKGGAYTFEGAKIGRAHV